MSGVLVTGATQPLGRRIVELLCEIGRPVLATGREDPGDIAQSLPPGVRYTRTDLTRGREVRGLLQGPCMEMGLDAVIHLAFHRAAGLEGHRVHRLNVDATRLLLRLAEEHRTLRRFVHRSTAEVYLVRGSRPALVREDQPLNLDPRATQWVRDRVEADITVCARTGLSPLHINVLRCAEILAPAMGSQLYDYFGSRVCLRPLGFDPVLNLLSLEDAARAFVSSLDCPEQGVLNIAGADTLPLSWAIRAWERHDIAVPGPLVGPLYRARAIVRRTDFRYRQNRWRFHFNAVLDGTRAADVMGFEPVHPIRWPTGAIAMGAQHL